MAGFCVLPLKFSEPKSARAGNLKVVVVVVVGRE